MSSDVVALIPSRRRDSLYSEIRHVVQQAEAVDRALAPISEAMAVDEALEAIVDLLGAELRQVRRVRRAKTLVTCAS